jgi:broad specificity phosphatase PhoE
MTLLLLLRHAAPGDDLSVLADRVAEHRPEAFYASPLARARATADRLARGAPVNVDQRLREIDFGEVEGLGFDELPPALQQALLHEPTRVRFPGGETYEELRVRVVEALDEIVGRHDRAAVVSHAGAIRAAFATWLRMDEQALWRIDQRHGALNVVEFVGGTPLVRLLNA